MVLAFVGTVLGPWAAHADEAEKPTNEPRQALAEALFQEARDLLAQGKAELACPKFAESQRIDPATGTLLNLASCHESLGKVATAWSEFTEAQAAAERDGRDDRVRFAKEHLQKLTSKLSHLRIQVSSIQKTDQLEVRLDEVPVGRPAWGTALPVDPGVHVVQAVLPGASPWRREVVIDDTAREVTVDVPALEASSPPSLASDAPNKTRRTLMFASLGVGAAGVVASGICGLYAFNRWHDAQQACPTGKGCNQTAMDARAGANASATAADIAFGVGLAGLAVATYLWATTPAKSGAPSASRVKAVPMVGPSAMGMTMEAHF